MKKGQLKSNTKNKSKIHFLWNLFLLSVTFAFYITINNTHVITLMLKYSFNYYWYL